MASNVYYYHVPFKKKKKSNELSLRTKKRKNKTMNRDKSILIIETRGSWKKAREDARRQNKSPID